MLILGTVGGTTHKKCTVMQSERRCEDETPISLDGSTQLVQACLNTGQGGSGVLTTRESY